MYLYISYISYLNPLSHPLTILVPLVLRATYDFPRRKIFPGI